MTPRPYIPSVGELRRSQVVTTFGPGAMLDLPDRSVLVGGLDYWHNADRQTPVVENRLRAKVAALLRVPSVRFYPPPVELDDNTSPRADIGVLQFPRWFLAQVDEKVERDGKSYRTRPLVPGKRLEKGKWTDRDRNRVGVVPVRFVQACPRGHIGDIDWYAFVRAHPSETLWLDEGGAGNDFAEIYVRSERPGSVPRQLADAAAYGKFVLGVCRGDLPWMGPDVREGCSLPSRLLTRSASNAYFPQLQSVIHIPDSGSSLRDAVDEVYEFLEESEGPEDVERERKKARVKAALEGHSAEAVWGEIERRKSGRPEDQRPIKVVEVETLRQQPKDRGEPVGSGDFFARSRDLVGLSPRLAPIVDRVVLVHRLREVVAQIGFTRFEAFTPDVNGELSLNVERASLASEVKWVPAIENRGEGVFVGVSASAIDAWLKRPAVEARGLALTKAFDAWQRQPGRKGFAFPDLPYYALHSLSHLLITEVSLSCGYAASSIRERVYVGGSGYGILLYTGGSGSEGTLGGLVEVGRHIEDHLERALECGRLCSNDPVCAQHEPDNTYEDRFLHGAACHGCLLIAETSCERFNQFLDRSLVVPTVGQPDCALFGDPSA